MNNTQITLLELTNKTDGKFVYIEDFMHPSRSYAYGHAGLCSVYIRQEQGGKLIVEYMEENKEIVLVEREDLLEELGRFDRENRVKNIFTQKEKDYANIMRLSATTINPYHVLSLKDKKKKMQEIFLKNEQFKTVEEVDLFLMDIGRVTRSISYNSYGNLEINFYTNRWGNFFLIDRDEEHVIISESQEDIQQYILRKLKIITEPEAV